MRGSRKITLTETGILLKKRAEEMLSLYEKTQTEISFQPNEIAGEVYIGGGESCSVKTIAQTACEVQKEYPSIRFNFYSGDAADVTEKLDKGLVDFGILVGVPDLSKYNSIRLPFADEWGVLMRKDSSLAQKRSICAEDLIDQQIITSHQSLTKDSQILKWFGNKNSFLNPCAKYNLIYNASLLVESGLGYALGLNNIINTSDSSALCFKPLSPAVYTNLDIGTMFFPSLLKSFLTNLLIL